MLVINCYFILQLDSCWYYYYHWKHMELQRWSNQKSASAAWKSSHFPIYRANNGRKWSLYWHRLMEVLVKSIFLFNPSCCCGKSRSTAWLLVLRLLKSWAATVHEPLTRYVKLRVAHAPGIPGSFSPPPTSKKTASLRSRHTSRHAPWCMSRSLTRGGREKSSQHSRRMRHPQFYVSGKRHMFWSCDCPNVAKW